MELTTSDSRIIQSRNQQIRGCIQVWAKCLHSARTVRQVLAAEPTTFTARRNLRNVFKNALKEEWSTAAASIQAANGLKAVMPSALPDNDSKGSSVAATAIRNTHGLEDMLWKEVFYKPLTIVKRLKRPSTWNSVEVAIVKAYLEDGIDYYLGLLKLFSSLHSSTPSSSTARTGVVVRCLCCLGDLARYYCTDLLHKLPTLPDEARYMVPAQYYNQVLELSPSAALAHSNLASVLKSIHNAPLHAALHYLAALRCSQFEGARVQLKQLMDHSFSAYSSGSQGQNSSEDHFLHTVLVTVSCFAVRDDKVSHVEVNAICQDFLVQLFKLLQSGGGSSAPHDTSDQDEGKSGSMSETMLLTAAVLVAAHKLQTTQQGSTCAVLLASVLLTAVCQCMSALQLTVTSLHSQATLLALTLATTPRPPSPQAVAGTSSGSSCGEQPLPAVNTAGSGGQKKRGVARRRRLRPRPQACNGDWNNSSGDEDDTDGEFSCSERSSSDRSGWSSDESSSAADQDLSSSEYDSGEDVIIESVVEVSVQSYVEGIKSASSSGGPTPIPESLPVVIPAPGTVLTQQPPATVNLHSASPPPPITSALEHLNLITIADTNEKHSQSSFEPTINTANVNNNSSSCNAGYVRPARSLLATVGVLTAWLRAESVAKGALVWSDEHSPDKMESSRVMWKALASYCNLICVDLRQLASTVNLDESMPNLKEFVLQIQTLTGASIMQHDCFALPEDSFLKSTLPMVVPEHVLQQPPGMQCQHVAPYLHHVGVFNPTPLSDPIPISNISEHTLEPEDMIEKMTKLFSEQSPNGALPPKTQSVTGACSSLNDKEESLLRTLRVRNDLRLLCQFEDCPVEYCEDTGLFSVTPSVSGVNSSASSTANSGSNTTKPYYLKKVAVGGYVMDKLVRRGTHPNSGEERRPPNTRRENGKQNRRTRGYLGKNRRRQGGRNRRNRCQDDAQEHAAPAMDYGRQRLNHEQFSRSRRPGPGQHNRRRDDRSCGFTHRPTAADDSGEVTTRLPDRYSGSNKVSSGSSATGSPSDIRGHTNETFALEDLKTSPLIDPTNIIPANGKFGAIGDQRKARTVGATGGAFDGGCRVVPQAGGTFESSTVMASTFVSTPGTGEEVGMMKVQRTHIKDPLTAGWLKQKRDTKHLMFLVPDATAIVYHLDTIKEIVQRRVTYVVVPIQVVHDIDEAKKSESAARVASRWLDRMIPSRAHHRPKNPYLRVQSAEGHCSLAGMQYPPSHHKTAWRWFQILECCHYLARSEYFPTDDESEEEERPRNGGSLYSDQHQNQRQSRMSQQGSPVLVRADVPGPVVPNRQDESLMDKPAVVTLLTAETSDTISKLPFSINSLASRVAAKLVYESAYKRLLSET